MSIVRAWDILVFLLVLFPLATGGVWISRPGLFIELSDLGIPAVIVTLTGLLLVMARKPIEESKALSLSRSLWMSWRIAVEKKPGLTLSTGALLVGSLWSAGSLVRHYAVNHHAMDLGIFVNALWNLVEGNGYISSIKQGANLFTDHQSPSFWLLAPVFKIFPVPETLLLIQAFCVAFGALALDRIGRQYLRPGHWALAALPLLYWGYLPIRNAVNFDFHPEVLMLPTFLAAIAGLGSERRSSRLLGVLLMAVSLGAKESAPVVAAGIGAAWLLGAGPEKTRSFTRKAGLVLIPVSLALFYFNLNLFPQFFGRGYAYESEFSQFGNGLGSLILAPFQKTGLFFQSLFGPTRLSFLFWTLAPIGFLPLLNWRCMAAVLPAYLMLFLTKGDTRVHIHFHYGIEPAVGLFWALPASLALAQVRFLKIESRTLIWCLSWALIAFGRPEFYRLRSEDLFGHSRWLRQEVLPCIDGRAPVSASVAMVSHLATRRWVSIFPTIEMPGPGVAVSCIVMDLSIRNYDMNQSQLSELLRSLPAKGYRSVLSCGSSFQVFARGDATCLKCVPKCPG